MLSRPADIPCSIAEREIPEEVAAKVDKENEFPAYMWQKMGEAGYATSLNVLLRF